MPNADNRTISLSSELAAVVDKAVEAGEYGDASEVVREALLEWQERRDLFGYSRDELRRLIQEGIDSGEPIPVEEAMQEVRSRIEKHRRAILPR